MSFNACYDQGCCLSTRKSGRLQLAATAASDDVHCYLTAARAAVALTRGPLLAADSRLDGLQQAAVAFRHLRFARWRSASEQGRHILSPQGLSTQSAVCNGVSVRGWRQGGALTTTTITFFDGQFSKPDLETAAAKYWKEVTIRKVGQENSHIAHHAYAHLLVQQVRLAGMPARLPVNVVCSRRPAARC